MNLTRKGFIDFWKNIFKTIGDNSGLKEVRAATGVFVMGIFILLMNPLTAELLRADMKIEWITFWIAVYYLFVGTVGTKLVIWLFKTKPEDLPTIPQMPIIKDDDKTDIKKIFNILMSEALEELNGHRQMLKEAESAAEMAVEKSMDELNKIQDEVTHKTDEAMNALKEATEEETTDNDKEVLYRPEPPE